MRVQSCWRNFTRLRARQSFYRLAGASISVAIANFNNITARCCTLYSRGSQLAFGDGDGDGDLFAKLALLTSDFCFHT